MKEVLENILKNQKEIFKIADKSKNQKLRELSASSGQLVREGQKILGLSVSK